MTERKYRCEAEIHDPRCDGWADSTDHFTPKKVARLLGWTGQQIGASENLQHLNQYCHTLKDRSTSARSSLARRLVDEENPESITLKKYQETLRISNGYIYSSDQDEDS